MYGTPAISHMSTRWTLHILGLDCLSFCNRQTAFSTTVEKFKNANHIEPTCLLM